MNLNISLIIPFKEAKSLIPFLQMIKLWDSYPSEIIIICSAVSKPDNPDDFVNFCKKNNIIFNLFHSPLCFPGEARNIGVSKSQFPNIAFLDSKTIPENSWLRLGYEALTAAEFRIVWGSTIFQATSFKAKVIRSSTYGVSPVKTLPGSILAKDTFNLIGGFIGWSRAGEDADWMARAELHRINSVSNSTLLTYSALEKYSYKEILIKWFRNYVYTSKLPYFRPHKNIYFYGLSLLSIFLAYNWNAYFADWDMASNYYVPNITKSISSLLLISYFVLRCLIRPYLRGERSIGFLIISFIPSAFFSLLIDIVKVLAFLSSKNKTLFKFIDLRLKKRVA